MSEGKERRSLPQRARPTVGLGLGCPLSQHVLVETSYVAFPGKCPCSQTAFLVCSREEKSDSLLRYENLGVTVLEETAALLSRAPPQA